MLNDARVASLGIFKDNVCTTRINKEKKFKIKFQVLLKFAQILPDYKDDKHNKSLHSSKQEISLKKIFGCISMVGFVFIYIPYTAEYNPQEYTTRTPTFDPKILEKMDFLSIDRTPNSAF